MSDDIEGTDEPAPKKSRLPLLIGLVIGLLGGGGAFYATWSGMLFSPNITHTEETEVSDSAGDLPDIAFVPIEPLTISLSGSEQASHLRFRAQLEVPSAYQSDVEKLLPRVIDVMNGYLRALRTSDIEDPAALMRLRSQMLRRVQIVTGEGRVNDLLVMEFVIN